jgi:hypothetical protein
MFSASRSKLTPQQALALKPVRLVQATMTQRPDGGAELKIPLRPIRWARWFYRLPPGATKTFELDALGLLVWNACDGHTSVQQIIRKLAKRYNLALREAQAPTLGFLQTLIKKGLVGMPVEKHKEGPGNV